jgi:hypothetical protein
MHMQSLSLDQRWNFPNSRSTQTLQITEADHQAIALCPCSRWFDLIPHHSCFLYISQLVPTDLLLCILDRKQTQIKHKQTDLRGSPKSGTSTEAADCILLEEWYKYSTQPNTTPQNSVFHSYTRFSQICTCTHSHSCTVFLSLCTHLHCLCTLYTSLVSICLHEKGKHKYSGCKREGGW